MISIGFSWFLHWLDTPYIHIAIFLEGFVGYIFILIAKLCVLNWYDDCIGDLCFHKTIQKS